MTKDDLISRQAAIDALRQQAETMSEWSNRYAEQRKGVLTAANIVEDLPPTQPEPCEDAVSRKAAIDGLNDAVHEHSITDFDAVATILALPPVTPKQCTGKWILGDMCSVKGYWATCSVCGHTSFGGGNFCRECGAKMAEGAGNDTYRRTD